MWIIIVVKKKYIFLNKNYKCYHYQILININVDKLLAIISLFFPLKSTYCYYHLPLVSILLRNDNFLMYGTLCFLISN